MKIIQQIIRMDQFITCRFHEAILVKFPQTNDNLHLLWGLRISLRWNYECTKSVRRAFRPVSKSHGKLITVESFSGFQCHKEVAKF